jgi:branched-subunit amino acid transport protein
MKDLYIWAVIIGLTGVTVLTRSFFLVLGDRIPLPERVQHAMRYAPACALAALVAPEVLLTQGSLATSISDPKLIAALAGVITMLTVRSMMLTIVVGMAVYTALRFL